MTYLETKLLPARNRALGKDGLPPLCLAAAMGSLTLEAKFPDLTIKSCTAAFLEATDIAKSEIVDQPFELLVGNDASLQSRNLIGWLFEQGIAGTVYSEIKTATCDSMPVRLMITPLRQSADRIYAFLVEVSADQWS